MIYVISGCKVINKLGGVLKEYEVGDNNNKACKQAFEQSDLVNKLLIHFKLQPS